MGNNATFHGACIKRRLYRQLLLYSTAPVVFLCSKDQAHKRNVLSYTNRIFFQKEKRKRKKQAKRTANFKPQHELFVAAENAVWPPGFSALTPFERIA
jgi:hypothetical protein